MKHVYILGAFAIAGVYVYDTIMYNHAMFAVAVALSKMLARATGS